MRFLNFFKSKKIKEQQRADTYFTLTTDVYDYEDPEIENIERAVRDATENNSEFAVLSLENGSSEIYAIQAAGVKYPHVYLVEILIKDNKNIYFKDAVGLNDTLQLFKEFYNTQDIENYSTWNIKNI